MERLSAQQLSSVSDTLLRLGVSSPGLQQRLARAALARADEFEPWVLERMQYAAKASPMPPSMFDCFLATAHSGSDS